MNDDDDCGKYEDLDIDIIIWQRKAALTSIVIVCLKEEAEEQKTWFSPALEGRAPDQILEGST